MAKSSTNSLKNYARRTVLEAARDYSHTSRRTKESTRAAFMDAMRGTATGWWNDLIYTADMLVMAHRYRKDIVTALAEYEDATGEQYAFDEATSFRISQSMLKATPWQMSDLNKWSDGHGPNAALIGLRFAVEWYTAELARDYCPNL